MKHKLASVGIGLMLGSLAWVAYAPLVGTFEATIAALAIGGFIAVLLITKPSER